MTFCKLMWRRWCLVKTAVKHSHTSRASESLQFGRSEVLNFAVLKWYPPMSGMLFTKTFIDIRRHNCFIIGGYIFRPSKWSSSGLLTDWVNRCCVHVGIPTSTQHLLTHSARWPEDDRLKGRNM